MAIPAQQVAEELRTRLPGIGQKQLHKLLYYCQGYHLAAFGERLFHEDISAWDRGPVVPSLWKSEQDYGVMETEPLNDEAMLNTIGYVASKYGNLSGAELERLTHGEPPWTEANRLREDRGSRSAPISPATLTQYFRRLDPDDDESPALDADELEALLHRSASRLPLDAPVDTLEQLRDLLDARA